MSEELTSTKIDEIARAATTLADAEVLVAGGASGGPARLVKALRVAEPSEIALTLVMSGSKVLAAHPELREDVASFLLSHLGIETTASPEALADSVARHLVLVELADLTDALPETLAHALPMVSAEQGRRCANLLKRWCNDRTASDVYRQVMGRASTDLDLAAQLDWDDRFTDVDTVPAYQELAFGEMLRRIGTGAFAEAEALAAARLRSIWAPIGEETQEWHQRWLVGQAVARLRRLLAAAVDACWRGMSLMTGKSIGHTGSLSLPSSR
jgi:hypothetical protein